MNKRRNGGTQHTEKQHREIKLKAPLWVSESAGRKTTLDWQSINFQPTAPIRAPVHLVYRFCKRTRCVGRRIFSFPPPSPLPIFPLNPYSLGEYLLAPILHSYWIQDGGLIQKCALARPKYACTAGYIATSISCLKISVFIWNHRAFSASIPLSGLTGFRASIGGLFYLSQRIETVKAVFTLKLHSKFCGDRLSENFFRGGYRKKTFPVLIHPVIWEGVCGYFCGQSLFMNRAIFLKLFSWIEFSAR